MRSTQHETTLVDADAILRITRAPKTPPTYVPRSRSLNDLPGGIRVPILQRPQSRVAARLEALQDGLQELTILREKQRELVHHVTERHSSDTVRDSAGQLQGSHLSRRRYSISALRSISEEKTIDRVQTPDDGINGSDRETVPGNFPNGVSATYSKRRRPSFQCDTIITKDFNQTIPYFPLQKESQAFPSPMHAVMRHYEVVLKSANSEQNLRKSASQMNLKSTSIQKSLESSVEQETKSDGPHASYLGKRRASLPVTLKSVKVTDLDNFWQNYKKGVDKNGNQCPKDETSSSLSLDTTIESTLSSVEEEAEQEVYQNTIDIKNQSTEDLVSNRREEQQETAL